MQILKYYEGIGKYKEFMLRSVENFMIKLKIFQKNKRKKDFASQHCQRCMYCGEKVEFGGNPADFLHYTDEDVFGKKVVCGFCDGIITQSNRFFKRALDEKKQGNVDGMVLELRQAATQINRIADYYEKERTVKG